jgi:hypothetical protein
VTLIGLDAITVDLKVFILRGANIVNAGRAAELQPYVTVGGGAYLLGDRFTEIAAGPGWEIGGGVDLWIGPYFSFGLKAQYRGVGLIGYDPQQRLNTYISLFTGSGNGTVHF